MAIPLKVMILAEAVMNDFNEDLLLQPLQESQT